MGCSVLPSVYFDMHKLQYEVSFPSPFVMAVALLTASVEREGGGE